jgi:hypothetical protein
MNDNSFNKLIPLIRYVERELGDFYGFVPAIAAENHLLKREELKLFLGDDVKKLPEYQGRAAVFFTLDQDDLFIGLMISDKIIQELTSVDPLTELSDSNLDAFCILVEELSHFHMILNRSVQEEPFSKLELEAQGEIDKLLISSILLKKQSGDHHYTPLARKLYDQAIIISADKERYELATKFAAKFWFENSNNDTGLDNIRKKLVGNYRTPWDGPMRAA